VLEAMATGVPVVSTDVGDVRNMVDKFGVVVTARSPVMIASAVIAAAGKYRKCKTYYPNVREYIECRFSTKKMLESYMTIFNR
jgi:glycosyltransferase involved in cell wall biosynthesis